MLRMNGKMIILAFAFLLVASSIEAKANSYLFRLTDAEINEVMSRYYPRGYDRDAALRQMSEPFECENFGDLCSEVGKDYAYRMVESAWTKARMGFPLEMIHRAAERESEDFGRRWFEETYPLGVPDKDLFWGEERAASPSSCSASAFAESGGFRIKNSSSRVNAGLVVWGRIKVEHFKKNGNGNWKLDKADRLEVQGTVYLSVGGNTTAQPVSDVDYDAKKVAASYVYGGTFSGAIPFVEGCGGVANSPLWACSCSGTLPPFQ